MRGPRRARARSRALARPARAAGGGVVLAAVLACAAPPGPGREREPCGRDGACRPDLECWSELCVRPPPAACARVAARLGAYADGEDLAAACRAARLTAAEGRCLEQASDLDAALACPRTVGATLAGLRAARAVDASPPRPPPSPDAGPPPGGTCADYLALLETLARCPRLPAASRTALDEALAVMRTQLAGPPDQAAMFAAVCAQGVGGLRQSLDALGCARP